MDALKNTFSLKELETKHRRTLKFIESTLYSEAANELEDLRHQSVEFLDQRAETSRRVLTLRMMIRQGHQYDDAGFLKNLKLESDWQKAEWNFVSGLMAFHAGDFNQGVECFSQAAEGYASAGWMDRVPLALFNAYIGRLNRGDFASTHEQITYLNQVRAMADQCERTKALIARQMSYFLQEQEAHRAALNEIKLSIEFFGMLGPISDYHLARLQAADLALALGESDRARLELDYVQPPFDARVKFPFAYVRARLDGDSLDPADFEVRSEFWILKWKKHFAATSMSSEIELSAIGCKPNSREALILKILTDGPATKTHLIERLWPELADSWTLENRFHKQISRMNAKNPGLIEFDGKRYRLNKRLKL